MVVAAAQGNSGRRSRPALPRPRPARIRGGACPRSAAGSGCSRGAAGDDDPRRTGAQRAGDRDPRAGRPPCSAGCARSADAGASGEAEAVAKPKPVAKTKPIARPVATKTVAVPHDRARMPLAALVAGGTMPDRGLLAFAGFALLLVAVGGESFSSRREADSKAGCCDTTAVDSCSSPLSIPCIVGVAPAAAASPRPPTSLAGTAVLERVVQEQRHGQLDVEHQGRGRTVGLRFKTISADTPVDGVNNRVSAAFTFGGPPLTADRPDPQGCDAAAVTSVIRSRAAADSDGWFNQSVFGVAFSGQDATSGVACCARVPPTPAATARRRSLGLGTCTDVRGNTQRPRQRRVQVRRDRADRLAVVDRPPDGKGWYRKPVTVSFAGTDADVRGRGLHGADPLCRSRSGEGRGRRIVQRCGR